MKGILAADLQPVTGCCARLPPRLPPRLPEQPPPVRAEPFFLDCVRTAPEKKDVPIWKSPLTLMKNDSNMAILGVYGRKI
jgi:hypothetical protein